MNEPRSADPVARWILPGIAAMIAIAAIVFVALRRDSTPPPAEIAKDPLLVSGREVYLSRCVSCHGETGRGDGPIAKSLSGPKPRNFSGEAWKHGDRPEQALAVVSKGVPDTSMPGWVSSYSPAELRAVTAYIYHLAGKSIPKELRTP